MEANPSFAEGYITTYNYDWVWNPLYHTFKILTDAAYARGVERAWNQKIEDLRNGVSIQ